MLEVAVEWHPGSHIGMYEDFIASSNGEREMMVTEKGDWTHVHVNEGKSCDL